MRYVLTSLCFAGWLPGCTGAVALGVPALEVQTEAGATDAVFGVRAALVIDLENIGSAQATVTPRVVEGPFEVLEDVIVIEPGDTATLSAFYLPDAYADLVGTLELDEGPTTFTVALSVTVTPDADGDGHRALGAGGDDCDDADPTVHGGVEEVCDGIDNDCSGVVDDLAVLPLWWPDLDADGWGLEGAVPTPACEAPSFTTDRGGDCDDLAASVNPNQVEVYYDGVDADCDGLSDYDADFDGHDCQTGPGCTGGDCDDADPTIHPAVAEVWYDDIDQNCDGNDDDQDFDGVDADLGDCDDTDPAISPLVAELDDGIDQDCDLLIDEDFLGPGSLIVAEFLRDPVATPPSRGRFLELLNPTDGHVDLTGLRLEMGPTGVDLPGGYLDPGGVLVLCVEPDPLMNGGITCDGDLAWFDPAGALDLVAGVLVIDQVDFSTWLLPSGASLELASDRLDEVSNDAPASWCPGQFDFGSGDLGTPGVVAPPCP